MKQLIDRIFSLILENETIPEELLYEFLQDTLEIVKTGDFINICDKFWDFQNYIEMFWRGRKYDNMKNKELIYQMGQLLILTNMIYAIIREKEQKVKLEDYAEELKNRYLVFAEMQKKWGITHKELAKASGLSPSALSQFLGRIKSQGFYTWRIMGREKHYYLTDLGEKLFVIMEKKLKNSLSYDLLMTNDISPELHFAEQYKKLLIAKNKIGIANSIRDDVNYEMPRYFDEYAFVSNNEREDLWKESSKAMKKNMKISCIF